MPPIPPPPAFDPLGFPPPARARMMAPGRPGGGQQQPPRVAPLEAQPLPFPHRHYRAAASNVDDGDSKPAADGSGGDDDGALDEYECKICFEILHEPRGCGSCPNRFCKECLEQVWKTAVRHPNVEVADLARLRIDTSRKAGKCPCCRAPFSLDDLVSDEDLVEKMSKAGKVICPFPGCIEEISRGCLWPPARQVQVRYVWLRLDGPSKRSGFT